MAELDTITVKGFKSIAGVAALPLGAINVLIGPNGSGKSNFIGVFELLHALREGRLQQYVLKAGGADRVLYFGSKVTATLQIQLSFQKGRTQYAIELQPTAADELIPTLETIDLQTGPVDATTVSHTVSRTVLSTIGKEAGISDRQAANAIRDLRERFDSWRLYHFHDTSNSSPLKKTGDLHDNRYLRPDGANLAPFLYFLRQKHENAYKLIRRTVQGVAPFFDDFHLEPQQLNPDKIRLEWRHKGSDAYFDGSALSDGTLRFIALTTLFLQPVECRPSVILVDEPELGLHPFAISLLGSLVKMAAHNSQVILSTQSSLLLDEFSPEDVLVAEREGHATTFRRLDPVRLQSWLEDYSLGELWEKNELGGRPTAWRG